MFRLHNLKALISSDLIPHHFGNLQTIRWRRKPRWLPVAKSKQFRVPPRTVTAEDEKLELMRLYNNYRTQMKAVRRYLHSEYNVKSVIVDTAAHEKEFTAEFIACSKINDAWNEQQRKDREARHAKELEEQKEIAYKRLDVRLDIRQKLLESVEEIVKKEKEASKSFITADNIDEAIEKALGTEVDYNYAIDLDGKMYHGRKTNAIEKL